MEFTAGRESKVRQSRAISGIRVYSGLARNRYNWRAWFLGVEIFEEPKILASLMNAEIQPVEIPLEPGPHNLDFVLMYKAETVSSLSKRIDVPPGTWVNVHCESASGGLVSRKAPLEKVRVTAYEPRRLRWFFMSP
jgi:hypothetical protein